MILRPFICGVPHVRARLVPRIRLLVRRDCAQPCMLSHASLLVAHFSLTHRMWVIETARRIVVTRHIDLKLKMKV